MTAPYRKELWHSGLHVLTCVFNSQRYRTRFDLYENFRKHIEGTGDTVSHLDYPTSANVPLWTIELAFMRRGWAVTQPGDPRDIRMRTGTELWHKERCYNIAVPHLPDDFKYIALVDADIQFTRHDWAEETIHMLQHHPVVQMWGEAEDLDPSGHVFQRHVSFAKSYVDNVERGVDYLRNGTYGPGLPRPTKAFWHPGFAWAFRREAWNDLGGLIDMAVLGSADNHMAKALIGDAESSMHPDISQGYQRHIYRWQERAEKYIRRNIGYVNGTIVHFWHGQKKRRRYWDRWKILTDTQFDPNEDLKPDWQGLWQLEDHGDPRSIELRDQLRNYFGQRNEDSIDFDESERKV